MRVRAFAIGVIVASTAAPCAAQVSNGFDLAHASVPPGEIVSGGVPRDGIIALTDPQRWDAEHADRWLADDDRVIGLIFDGDAMAYPLRVLNRHEIVNDVVGEQPVAVTYCPLCRSAIVFDAHLAGRRRIFGVSGLLYQSNMLIFDRATDSLVSQLLRRGITGALNNTRLNVMPARHTTWARWYRDYPQTSVLARDVTLIDYGSDPYATYHRSATPMFRVRGDDRSRRAKSFAYALTSVDRTILIVEEDLVARAADEPLVVTLPDGSRAVFDPVAGELDVDRHRWRLVPGYWFALTSFLRESEKWDPLTLEQSLQQPR